MYTFSFNFSSSVFRPRFGTAVSMLAAWLLITPACLAGHVAYLCTTVRRESYAKHHLTDSAYSSRGQNTLLLYK